VYPKGLRYSKEHEWAKAEGKRVRVGITKFAADHLSDVVYIELPAVGAEVKFMEPFGVVESVKAVRSTRRSSRSRRCSTRTRTGRRG